MSPLQNIILEHLQHHACLTVHDFMALCLQDPQHGYYRKAQAVGAEGDFITAPEISQAFGDLLGMWLVHAWQMSGMPLKAALVELGPGRGTLAADILRIIKKNKDTANVFSLHLVESNATLREEQAKKLWQHQPQWHEAVAEIPTNKPLFIIANEFFDALPIRQFVGDAERHVVAENGGFAFAPEGAVSRETCPAAEEILRQLATKLRAQGGVALIVDYGYTTSQHADTLQALRQHHYHPVLEMPGEADLTAHVDFARLAEVAKEEGLIMHGVAEQGTFLQRIGGDIWMHKLLLQATHNKQKELLEGWNRLVSPNEMGTLFKVMALTPKPCELAGLR